MKQTPRENYRWTAHTGGLAIVKPKDYDFSGEVDAATPYAAWKMLLSENNSLQPGDLLEIVAEDGTSADLRIAKYIGFEPAKWFVPEPAPPPVELPSEERRAADFPSNSEAV